MESKLADALDVIARLQARVEALERRLAQTSQNSSRPPSSDPPGAGRTRPVTRAKPRGRKPGGQPGHKGTSRKLLPPEQVAEIEDHWPCRCNGCGHPLPRGAGQDAGPPARHQVTEVPPITPTTTEHRLHSQRCPRCAVVTAAVLPGGVPRGAFGPRLVALVGLLSGCYRMSKRTVVGVLADLFGVELSLGSVSACEQTVSATLAAPVAEAHEQVQTASVVHADETSWREGRGAAWLWVAATATVTVFRICGQRSKAAAQALLGAFHGVLVSDRWGAYRWYGGQRQVCWAHLKRDFQAMSEHEGWAGWIGHALLGHTREIFRLWHRIRDGTLSRPAFRRRMQPIRREIERLLALGQRTAAPIAGTCKEMRTLLPAFFTFVDHEGIEPTNNLAERQLRHAVIWRTTSFGTHSADGSRFVERILTARATLRQQERNVVEYLVDAMTAFQAGREIPSLLPTPAAPARAAA